MFTESNSEEIDIGQTNNFNDKIDSNNTVHNNIFIETESSVPIINKSQFSNFIENIDVDNNNDVDNENDSKVANKSEY